MATREPSLEEFSASKGTGTGCFCFGAALGEALQSSAVPFCRLHSQCAGKHCWALGASGAALQEQSSVVFRCYSRAWCPPKDAASGCAVTKHCTEPMEGARRGGNRKKLKHQVPIEHLCSAGLNSCPGAVPVP